MKALFLAAVCLIIISSAAYSSSIEVGVKEIVKGSALSISYDNATSTVAFSTEFYNTGSIGYKTRMRLRIMSNDTIVFDGWSKEKEMSPGEKDYFEIFWNGNSSGKYSADIKAYYGNEITDYKDFEFTVNNIGTEDDFEITGMRTYDNYVVLDIYSKKNASVVIMPSGYTNGWIFEQAKVDIAENQSKTISINYVPTLWNPSSVDIAVASTDGRFYSSKTFEMKKDPTLEGMVGFLIDRIKIFLSA